MTAPCYLCDRTAAFVIACDAPICKPCAKSFGITPPAYVAPASGALPTVADLQETLEKAMEFDRNDPTGWDFGP